jgi:hypothetical protein
MSNKLDIDTPLEFFLKQDQRQLKKNLLQHLNQIMLEMEAGVHPWNESTNQ